MNPAAPAFALSSAGPALVGVFDSGVGGLSVLRALREQLPSAQLLYVADSAHAPYGERDDAFVTERTHRMASHLLAHGARLLVVACNTATAIAMASLRERWPQLPTVGVEPGLKPAIAASRNRRVGVLATPGTLRSDKFRRLLGIHGEGCEVLLQPCPGLAGMIERGRLRDPALAALIASLCRPLKDAGVDTVVLGCTHYPFVSAQVQAAMGDQVQLVDTAHAVARQALRLWEPLQTAGNGTVRLQTTGDVARLQRLARRWLPFDFQVAAARGL